VEGEALRTDHRLVAADLLGDPYPLFEQLRRTAPVWHLPGENAFLVSTWELVADAARRVQDFSNHFRYTLFSHEDGTLGALETGAIGPDVFAGEDPPVHTAQRKIFFAELVQQKIDAVEPSSPTSPTSCSTACCRRGTATPRPRSLTRSQCA